LNGTPSSAAWKGPSFRAAFERAPVDAGRVEPMYGGPAAEPLADIGRDALFPGETDQDRHEAVIAMTMHRRGKPDGGCAHAALGQGDGRRF
jgi:hypothetical protein